LQSSLALDEQLGLAGPQSAGYFSPSHIEFNPWHGCSPCKWKVPLLQSGLPIHPQPNKRNTLLSIDEDVDEIHYSASHVQEEEWKIRWAKLLLSLPKEQQPTHTSSSHQTSSSPSGLDELKIEIAHQLHAHKLHFVFDSEGNEENELCLIVWVYEIPGQLGPKTSPTENTLPDHAKSSNHQGPPPLIDPILMTYQSFEHHSQISSNSPHEIKACQAGQFLSI
jgi:hypothetical protein